jgi:uncharacterized OB-fold protein
MTLPSQAGFYKSKGAFSGNEIIYFACPFCGLVFNPKLEAVKHCNTVTLVPRTLPQHDLWQQEKFVEVI